MMTSTRMETSRTNSNDPVAALFLCTKPSGGHVRAQKAARGGLRRTEPRPTLKQLNVSQAQAPFSWRRGGGVTQDSPRQGRPLAR